MSEHPAIRIGRIEFMTNKEANERAAKLLAEFGAACKRAAEAMADSFGKFVIDVNRALDESAKKRGRDV